MIRKFSNLVIASLIFLAPSYTQEASAQPKRVYVDAVADLMHAGHVAMFKRAKECGEYLIVGIHSDAVVASYKRWPILTMEERIAVVAACRYVDEVIPNAPLNISEEYIKEHQIDLVIHGDDINPETIISWYGTPIRLGIFKTISYTTGISTTNIIQRIIDRYSSEETSSQE